MTILNPFFRLGGRVLLCCVAIATIRQLHAGFQYNNRDLILGFRQTTGSSDLVVNLGSVTNIYTIAPGVTITITNLATNQLRTTFANLNRVSWSVTSTSHDSGDTNFPLQTLWVTGPRVSPGTQTEPWVRKSSITQGTAGGKIYGIGVNAVDYGSQHPAGPDNTDTGVVISASDLDAYRTIVGSGNLSGTFQGNIESTTPDNFDTGGQLVRSDLYELKPGSGATLNTPGTYLGYFEFRPDGTMTFTAAGGSTPVPPRPDIISVLRNGITNTIAFTTTNNATYRLLYTNSAGLTAPIANWPAAGTPISGTGTTLTVEDASSDLDRFYLISVSP
jgi:hypothetical protein